jgi:basic membrane protein A
VAEQRGVHAFGWDSDMSKYGPHSQLTANTENWSDYYVDEIRKVMAGTWTGGRQTADGIKEKMVVLTPLNKSVPSDVARLFEERKRDIADGKLKPFVGPLKDSTGVVRVAAGSALSDAELLAINWYVDGVDASIPK